MASPPAPDTAEPDKAFEWESEEFINQSPQEKLQSLISAKNATQASLIRAREAVGDIEEKHDVLQSLCEGARYEVAKQRCHDFAARFHALLPAELRTMVYTYIWKDEAVAQSTAETVSWIALTRSNGERDVMPSWDVLCVKPCNCFDDFDLPFCVRQEFVGFDVAMESIAYYYKIIGVPVLSAPLQIYSALFSDHFHANVIPADHIRHAQILVKPYFGLRVESMADPMLRLLKREFERLSNKRLKKGIKISVRLEWDDAVCKNYFLFRTLCPILAKMVKSGLEVSIVTSHYYTEKEYDISSILDMELDEWLAGMRKTLEDDLQSFACRRFGHTYGTPMDSSVIENYGFYEYTHI